MRIDIREQVKLDKHQLTKWQETLTAFSWTASPFTHILYEMLNPDKGHMVATFLGTSLVPNWYILGTNGKRVFICAERFFEKDLLGRIFLLAHEVSHPMLGHIVASHYYRQLGYIQVGLKKMPYNDVLANYAQDFVINDMLVQSRIGTFVEGGCWDVDVATFKDSWIDVYEKLLTECQDKSRNKMTGGDGEPFDPGDKEQEGVGNEPGDDAPKRTTRSPSGKTVEQRPFDGHMGFGEGEPDPKTGEPAPGDVHITDDDFQRETQRAQQATAAAMELARARGKLPAALRYIGEKMLEPVIDWTEHLKAQFARKLGSGTYDFRRPDRRLMVRDIIVPGRSGFRARTIILGADSSGSIYMVPELISRWMGECSGIMEEVRPEEIHVVWCDATVQRVDILTDPMDVRKMFYRGAKGGGGTHFEPVFEYVKTLDREIDCMAYLTDGDGTFPKRAPDYPVIWGSILQPPSHYPFGDTVMIPVPRKS